MISVVVVDDSAFMRKALSTMLEKDPEIRVAATAKNGQEGLEAIRVHKPDVVTLDIEMPVMDGLTALRHIMMEMPRPVLMVSSLTSEGAEATLKAMELGAVDYIPKQLSRVSLDIVKIEDDLRTKVKSLAQRSIKPQLARAHHAAPVRSQSQRTLTRPTSASVKRDVIAIGVSTGGPPAVQKVLSSLPADMPASIVIAQHMPAAFTGPFAKRLDSVCQISVREAVDGEPLQPGVAYISPGGKHLRIRQRGSRVALEVSGDPADALYKPSANELITSVAQVSRRRALGVILTGMGYDGAEGMKLLKANGGLCIAQNDASCVVYGMPKAVVDAGLADEVLDIDEIGAAIWNRIFN